MPYANAPHFSESELGGTNAPAAVRSNLSELAALLESFRRALDVPLRVTSGYRTPAHNEQVGGVSTSQHLDGTGADVVPVGLSLYEAALRIEQAERAGQLPVWGQVIYYPYTTGHIHISLPTRGARNEKLVKLGGETGGYAKLDLGTFPVGSSSANAALRIDEAKYHVAAFVAVVGILYLITRE